ncbi:MULTISPECIES: arsenic resistance N-acetyltransferase ArsN2 [unclassified Rhizobium]|uniref:arsenic resistance N-acetyltransferase ArsN2 n=1 Tax=unclassified Rhizobium TaxID=2613769 RepID=UPI002168F63D|nr:MULTISPECIES: arsenic resistance N-acetyltransferase ArsN2 [unclassified Rhizobium]MCS3743891.1 N-acetylglutamate synthase-like GNAT family acetyltransferase [Rhizobium sp. BK661]MCS4095986.1 N-acetylglutamate synthase-like GNAT family acetyltransferase [Rhizobium sp. BK176]
MYELTLAPIWAAEQLKTALAAAGLPIDDVDGPDRAYFRLVDDENQVLGYAGIEAASDEAVLLRSVVIVPEFRSRGYGRHLTEMTLARIPMASEVYLVTTSAASFFERVGFQVVARDQVPQTILSTRQLSGICPASATIMKLTRRPAT